MKCLLESVGIVTVPVGRMNDTFGEWSHKWTRFSRPRLVSAVSLNVISTEPGSTSHIVATAPKSGGEIPGRSFQWGNLRGKHERPLSMDDDDVNSRHLTCAISRRTKNGTRLFRALTSAIWPGQPQNP